MDVSHSPPPILPENFQKQTSRETRWDIGQYHATENMTDMLSEMSKRDFCILYTGMSFKFRGLVMLMIKY